MTAFIRAPSRCRQRFSDRIEFFQSDSRKTELPERVNVIVSDIRACCRCITVMSSWKSQAKDYSHGGIRFAARHSESRCD